MSVIISYCSEHLINPFPFRCNHIDIWMLLHIAFILIFMQWSKHSAVFHMMSIDYRVIIWKISGIAWFDINRSRQTILPFRSVWQIIIIIGILCILLAQHRIADFRVRYINPCTNIFICLPQRIKIHLRNRSINLRFDLLCNFCLNHNALLTHLFILALNHRLPDSVNHKVQNAHNGNACQYNLCNPVYLFFLLLLFFFV